MADKRPRSQLRAAIADAVRAQMDMDAETDAYATAEQAATATGLRRILWSSLNVAQQQSLIRGAIRDAKEGKE